jgi:hypothetical protein
MKKLKKLKLAIKKVTLRDLDEKSMEGMAGGGKSIQTLCAQASVCTAANGIPCC